VSGDKAKKPDRKPVSGREHDFHMAADRRGEPCACDDKTACLAHWALSRTRRWLRPK
jgi:hypothetical protein